MNTNFMTAKAESPTMNDTIPLPTLIRRLLLLDSVFSLLICFNLPTDFVLNLIEAKCAELYPNIKIDSYSPPFIDEFSVEDNNLMIERVNKFNPDILFVGMTAPKQEKWVYTNHKLINARKVLAVGAAFDWFCGVQKIPSKVWVNMGLGWFVRFLGEPKRMFRRVFISSPIYVVDVITVFFTKK